MRRRLQPLPTAQATRRLVRWLLLSWLLAIGCAGSAPLLDFTPTLDCAAHKRSKDATPAKNRGVLTCSQCLPVAPPGDTALPSPTVQRAARAATLPRAPEPAWAFAFPSPPARAPPSLIPSRA